MIPRMVVAVGDLGPDNLHHARASFHQTPGEHGALAESVAPVAVANFVRFLLEVKGVAGTS